MNTLLEAPAQEAETVDLRHFFVGGVWKANGCPPNQDGPVPLWLKARARTIDFRRDDLVRTHWKKVCRPMQDD